MTTTIAKHEDPYDVWGVVGPNVMAGEGDETAPDASTLAAIILARLEEYARDDAQRDWQQRQDARRRP